MGTNPQNPLYLIDQQWQEGHNFRLYQFEKSREHRKTKKTG